MKRNMTTRLARRRRKIDPMAEFDRLPAPARHWAHHAVLPWSAASIARIWARTVRKTGSEQAALARLDAIETATLLREPASRASV